MGFAVMKVLTIPVELVCKDDLGITPKPFLLPLDRLCKPSPFVEVVPAQSFDPAAPVYLADSDLGSEFHPRACFSPHDWPHMRLGKAYDAVFDPVMSPFIHLTLLPVYLRNDQQIFVLPGGQGFQ